MYKKKKKIETEISMVKYKNWILKLVEQRLGFLNLKLRIYGF